MFIDLVQLHAGGVEAVEVVEEGRCFAMLALASSSLLQLALACSSPALVQLHAGGVEAVDEGEERAVLHHVVAGLVPGHRVPLPRLPRVP